ncbi:MAG TPA: hypothetical protein VFB81_05435 [Myxococcales bacterium]|nr:hypothetical protein [Myxococcales bacterium]
MSTSTFPVVQPGRPIIQALPVDPPAKVEAPAPVEVAEVEEEIPAVRPSMFDLVLRRPRLLDRVLRDERSIPKAIQDLVSLSVIGFSVYGLVVGASAQLVHDRLGWNSFFTHGTPAVWTPLSFVLAFLGAIGICLPSFYFFTQLSGLDASFRSVTAQALRGAATTAVLLLGAAPFYGAWVLGNVVGVFSDVRFTLQIGMVLPFIIGLFGVGAVERAFRSMVEVVPITHRRRGNFVRRMVMAWGALFTAIAPVALYRLGEWFGSWL